MPAVSAAPESQSPNFTDSLFVCQKCSYNPSCFREACFAWKLEVVKSQHWGIILLKRIYKRSSCSTYHWRQVVETILSKLCSPSLLSPWAGRVVEIGVILQKMRIGSHHVSWILLPSIYSSYHPGPGHVCSWQDRIASSAPLVASPTLATITTISTFRLLPSVTTQ